MRTIQSEWIKLRTIRSNQILVLGAFLFPFVIVTLAATFGSVADGPNSLEMAELVMGLSVVTSMLLGVVTAIGLTSEYTHNTIRPTYAATQAAHARAAPRRGAHGVPHVVLWQHDLQLAGREHVDR